MKRIIVFLLICVSFNNIHAQRVTISSPTTLGFNTRYKLLGEMEEALAVFMDKGSRYELHLYDEGLNKLKEQKLRDVPSNTLMSGVFLNDQKLELFYSYGRKDSTYLVHQSFWDYGRESDSTTILKIKDRNYNIPFYFTQSEDKSKVLLFKPGLKNQIQTIAYDVNTQRLLWEKTFHFDRKIEREFQLIEISNEAVLYLVLDKNNTRVRSADHNIKVYRYSGKGEIELSTIDFQDKYTYAMTGVYDNLNGNLVLSGYYAENTFSLAKGIFYFQLKDMTGKVNSYFHPFDYKTLQDMDNQRKRKVEGISDLQIAEILLTADGGVILIGEIRREYFTRMNYSSRFNPSMNSNIDYYYEDVLATAISPHNTINWTRIIHKRQFSQDDNGIFSSFFTFKVPSFIQLVFNDEISSNSTVSAFGINGIGDVNRTNLMSTGLQDLRIRFRRAIQVSSNSFLVPSDFKSELKLVLVKF